MARSDKGQKHNISKKTTGYINVGGMKVAKIQFYKARKGTLSRENFIKAMVKASGGPDKFSAEDIYARLNSRDLASLDFNSYIERAAAISRRKSFWAADLNKDFAATAFKASMQEIINKIPEETVIAIQATLNSNYINFMEWSYNNALERLEYITDGGEIVWVKVNDEFVGEYDEETVQFGVE